MNVTLDPSWLKYIIPNSTPNVIREEMERLSCPNVVLSSPTYSHQDWRYIARFINPNVEWRLKSLTKAYEFICQTLTSCRLDSNFKVGLQTPNEPYNINICLLYVIVSKYGITTYPTTTVDELVFALKSYLFSKDIFFTSFTQELKKKKREELINICLLSGISFNSCNITYDLLLNIKTSQEEPVTHLEIISYVAEKYKIDLTQSENVYHDLHLIKRGKYLAGIDCLKNNFNPVFPPRYYSNDDLHEMCKSFGFTSSTHQGMYDLLAEQYLCNNFYPGILPKIINTESPFDLDDLEECSNNIVICYGNYINGFTFMTYKELAAFFRANRSYLHPLDNKKQLDLISITRLKYLGEKYSPDLYNALLFVDAFHLDDQEMIDEFLRKYQLESLEIQDKIQEALQELLDLSMYMRGWSGDGKLPIEETEIHDQVDIKVSQGLINWQEKVITGEWKKWIEDLPLVRYVGGFIHCNDERIGLTIGDKLRIIEMGERDSNIIGSCVRASSGWLACSAYRYMCLIGMTTPFNINKLVYIS